MNDRGTNNLRFANNHPSLAGHFPGNPIIPGALLLLRLQALAEETSPGWRLAKVNSVKFLYPVLPDETLEVDCRPGKNSRPELANLKLTISRNQQIVCEANFTMNRRDEERQ